MTKDISTGFEKVVDLVEIAGSLQPLTAVMAGGERVEDLLLVESARDHGIINRIVLVGRKQLISDAVAKVGIDVPEEDILAAENDEEAAAVTVDLLKAGVVQMVLKGSTPTPILHRHMLPLAVRNTVSLVSIFDAAPIGNGRPMILTDAGVTTVCNYARIAGLIQNAVDVAHSVMQIEKPRVALLSANEKILPTLPSTQLGAEFARRGWSGATVYGPLSLDLATDPGAVASKGLPDIPAAREVAGQADILVCPGIDTGNAIYKMISALIKYGEASLANIIMGFPKPYVLLSRSDALETRLNSVALGAIYAQRGLGATKPFVPVAIHAKTALHRIVVINPGSTSTKVALYENEKCVQSLESEYLLPTVDTVEERQHQADELTQRVLQVVQAAKWKTVDAIAARGGFLPRPPKKLSGGTCIIAEVEDGTVLVNELLVAAMLEYPAKQHASNLGVPVAAALAKALNAPAYIVDPVVEDNFVPEAEISGYKGITRQNISHALSVRAAARKAAQTTGRPLEDINLVIAHLGGEATIAAVRNGRISDSSIAFLDGGLQSHLDEYQLDIIETRIRNGDEEARLIVEAMTYQIAKEIGAMYVAAGCDVESIVLTGDVIRVESVRNELRKRIGRLAPLLIFDEALEMGALAAETLRILTGESQPRRYQWKQPDGAV